MLLLSSSKQNVDIRFFLVNPLTILISHEILLFSKTERHAKENKIKQNAYNLWTNQMDANVVIQTELPQMNFVFLSKYQCYCLRRCWFPNTDGLSVLGGCYGRVATLYQAQSDLTSGSQCLVIIQDIVDVSQWQSIRYGIQT